jgi:hypothetical protein
LFVNHYLSFNSKKLALIVNRPDFRALLALWGAAAYAGNAVKQPLINVEETIDRFVGRRTGTPDALSTATSNKAEAIAWRKAFGGVRVPRGVHRFKTHEDADQWLWRMIARPTN